MEWKFRSDLPIYSQIVEQFRQSIVSGKLSPGQRLESVRDLSMEAGVNPNTMQRALQELEREGLVYTQRTAGRFVSEDAAVIERGKRAMAMEKIREFLSAMNSLGYSREEILSLLSEEKEEENNADS
jgi:DNA-binding transcriptional regulator YhcF (GntR family)